MAKAATSRSSAKPKAAKAKTKTTAKTATKTKTRAKATKASTKPRAKAAPGPKPKTAKRSDNAADALIGLVESPLVADLLAAAVTAAAATMLEHRLKSRRGQGGSLVKAVGAAAATAVGRHLADEIAEIRKATKNSRDGSTR